MQAQILAANFLREQGAVFVAGRNDDAVRGERLPIGGAGHPHPDAAGRDGGVGQIKPPVQFGDAAVFNAERFQFPLPQQRRLFFSLEVNAVVAGRQPQVGQRGEITFALILKHARVFVNHVGVVQAVIQNGDCRRAHGGR